MGLFHLKKEESCFVNTYKQMSLEQPTTFCLDLSLAPQDKMLEVAACWFPAAQPQNNHIDTELIISLLGPLILIG